MTKQLGELQWLGSLSLSLESRRGGEMSDK